VTPTPKGAHYYLKQSKLTQDSLATKYLTLLGAVNQPDQSESSQISFDENVRGSVRTQLVPHPAASIASITSSSILAEKKFLNAEKGRQLLIHT